MINKPSKKIQPFGDLKWFKKENAPEGSTERCGDGCKVETECPYSAQRIYYRKRIWIYDFDMPEDKSKHGDYTSEKLKTNNYATVCSAWKMTSRVTMYTIFSLLIM